MKTERITGIAEVTHTGTCCNGVMPWESPYIVFKVFADETTEDSLEVRWQSEEIPRILDEQDNLYQYFEAQTLVGCFLDFDAYIRTGRVWRIKNLKYR